MCIKKKRERARKRMENTILKNAIFVNKFDLAALDLHLGIKKIH